MHTTFHLHVCTPPRYTSIPLALPQQPDPALPHLSVVPLPSTRTIQIQHTTAVRRGAAWPARRPSGCLVVRGHNTGGRLSVRSLGMAAKEGPDAGCGVVTVSAFVSGIRCPVSGASVRCPTGACPGDRCPVRASERPGVQCPASGVCASRCPTGSEVAGCGGGRQPYGLGWPGSAWSPAMSMTAGRLPEVGAWRSKLAQAVLGQRRVDLDLVVVVGGG
jgi:hypothetical protein